MRLLLRSDLLPTCSFFFLHHFNILVSLFFFYEFFHHDDAASKKKHGVLTRGNFCIFFSSTMAMAGGWANLTQPLWEDWKSYFSGLFKEGWGVWERNTKKKSYTHLFRLTHMTCL